MPLWCKRKHSKTSIYLLFVVSEDPILSIVITLSHKLLLFLIIWSQNDFQRPFQANQRVKFLRVYINPSLTCQQLCRFRYEKQIMSYRRFKSCGIINYWHCVVYKLYITTKEIKIYRQERKKSLPEVVSLITIKALTRLNRLERLH